MYRSALPTHCSARESGARDAHLIFYATGLLFVVGAVWLFNRLVRLRNQGKGTPTTVTQVAAPTSATGDRHHAIRLRISDQGWWVVGAGLLVLLVASETTRVSVRRAKHRKQA